MDLQQFLTPALTCAPETSLAHAAQAMDRHGVGSIVVLGPGEQIVGIATDRDIAVRGTGYELLPSSPISQVMTKDVVLLRWDADLFDAASTIAASECRRLPVVDDDSRLRGVVTLDDLMVLFARQTDSLANAVAAEIAVH
jgi:CBS domain-containing protein